MYLSRVELDMTRRATMRALAAPQMLHGAVERSFSGERRRRLWRLDRLGEKRYLLLLSEDRPDLSVLSSQFGPLSGGEAAATKAYDPLLRRILQGSTWRFRLTANPTKSCATKGGDGGRGKVCAHCTVAYQQRWLLERAEKHGFSLGEEAFTVTDCRWLQFKKGQAPGRPVSLLSVTYEGVLQVTDPERFCALLTHGIGRGKAYGLGLMTVVGGG